MKKKLKTQIMIYLGSSIFTLFAASLCFTYSYTSKIVTNDAKQQSTLSAQKYAGDINNWLSTQKVLVEDFEKTIEEGGIYDKNALKGYLNDKVKINPQFISLYAGFENKVAVFNQDVTLPSDWVCTERGWYKSAISANKTIFTAPYVDAVTKKLIISLASPIQKDGKVIGVLGADISLDFVKNYISNMKIDKNSYVFLLDGDNEILMTKDTSVLPTEEKINKFGDIYNGLYKTLDNQIKTNDNGVLVSKDYDNTNKYFSFTKVPTTNWTLGFSIPKNVFDAQLTTLLEIFILIAVGFLAIFLFLINGITDKIVNPIKELNDKAKEIADGNLNIDITSKSEDEIGVLSDSFRKIVSSLNSVLYEINSASQGVATGSKQIANSSHILSNGSTEQASAIEQLTASMQEISSQTQQNASNALTAKEIVDTTKETALSGNKEMKQMVTAMEEINEASANISKIIKVIDEIAFQTNILALNAAVEAARAGQHGKGFAVVADEVRNLAARSANAAKETTALIEGSITKTEDGTKIANATAQALDKIVEEIAMVVDIVAEISTASNEQSNAVTQINQGIMQVSDVIQTNSSTAQESAAASSELSRQADLLKELTNKFKLKR